MPRANFGRWIPALTRFREIKVPHVMIPLVIGSTFIVTMITLILTMILIIHISLLLLLLLSLL